MEDKLYRKYHEYKDVNKKFPINVENYNNYIHDLVGVRILHLHSNQLEDIHNSLIKIFREHKYILKGKPIGYTWDIENKNKYIKLGIKPKIKESSYTSVHYIVKNNAKTNQHIEIQVRTLMEEVWGEVSHSINYPHETTVLSCQEQLKALARIASGGTRLVDSIYNTYNQSKEKT